MKLTVNKNLDKELLLLGCFENETKTTLDLEDELTKTNSFKGKFSESYVTRKEGKSVLVVGLGKKDELTAEKLRKALAQGVNYAKKEKITTLATDVVSLVSGNLEFNDKGPAHKMLGRATAEAVILANYRFNKYFAKERKEKESNLEEVSIVFNKDQMFEDGLKEGTTIANATNFVKDLVNEPANVANSLYLEKAAKEVAKNKDVTLKVLNEDELKKLGMGSLLGVNKGSANPPKLIILQYSGSKDKPIALVGKGITFDSGGYNLKPTKYIEDMKTDMAGSAAVLGTIKVASELGIKKNLIGVMAVCENMVSSLAQRPGDIVKAYNGKTIEITNTDAEGRLVLADALAYTEEHYKPEIMIDLATLTGACVVALGYYAAGLISKDDSLVKELTTAGMASNDRVWQLPFFDDYHDHMDGTVSDLRNTSGKGKGYEGGSITAGVFLSKFVDTEKTRWVHLDIAGSAYWIKGEGYIQEGATGSGVRLLSYWLLG